IKNNAGLVKYSLTPGGEPIEAGNKAGLLMGDYSRAAINTSFNTGTVIGVSCNVFGETPSKHVKNFSWGPGRYQLERAITDIEAWKKMKGFTMDENEKLILRNLYNSND
ncbi:MAG TPA: hypothetical protein VK498_05130, partial [Ferruginibacter sp.]|nr:hypothetical protein [Ferruginibacter sp.]